MTGSTPSPSRRGRRRTAGAAAVLAAAAATAVLALALDGPGNRGGRAGEPAAPAGEAVPAPADESVLALARRDASDPLATGRADAPVVMIEYSDFQCPFCGRFARGTLPELLRSYVDKGVLRIEWRSFPLFGEESEQAALAAWAAGRQGRFWEFHDIAYGEPRDRGKGAFGAGNLLAMAREAGVADIGRFRADMASAGARDAVRRDREEGYGLGVSSTPAFLVNGRPILGAQPTAVFREAVEAAAKAAGR
ncbi:DsbA family protein [Streptomyces sp. SHP 1-2]|uniref:DsbA family protein n=1 Tax=Streptomyces sp. SHP 1-2 TaxID=2769489 RepID=UPI0022370CFA|nr:DsbA family protein [Streptomyces sp. SHP 1-2]MCW5251442.1 thioredoxin domain-containing protein [Streptomyces sp. SHP 1-2]